MRGCPIDHTGGSKEQKRGEKKMNNMQIIANEAVASGYFTEEEVSELIEEGKDIPFHTYAIWKSVGLVPKAGTHGWACRLWRKKKNKSEVDEQEATEEERKKDHSLTLRQARFPGINV